MSCEKCEELLKYCTSEQIEQAGIFYCYMCGTPLSPAKALTWDELKLKRGKLIWVADVEIDGRGCEELLISVSEDRARTFNLDNDTGYYDTEDYGKTWLAYDREPEEGHYEKQER